MLAAESARREASKLSAGSALMVSLSLRRDVERVFRQHSLADTGAAYINSTRRYKLLFTAHL